MPTAILFTFLILSSLGLWYKQVIFQGVISERLKENRGVYIESESLLPFLKERAQLLSISELAVSDPDFLEVEIEGKSRVKIGRSELKGEKIRFQFNIQGKGQKVMYHIEEHIATP